MLLFVFLCVQAGFLFADRTGGNCSIKEEKDGADVLELYTGVDFYSVTDGKNWQKIWVDCWIQTRFLFDGIRLKTKARLYNKHLKVIGKVVQSFNPMKLLEERDSMTHIVVSGFMENACTDKDFIAETDLSALLLKASSNARLGYFESFIEKYGFIKKTEDNKYTSYLINEPDFVKQTLNPRILMIFYNDELIAIFHSRPITVKLYDSIEMGSEYKMIYNSKFTEHVKNEMVGIYKKKLNN
ncbi:MAG: hypothetical protein Q8M15_04480 [Bacteroidota bacterium]|nr:hypothetical protein [Bacteroidota bacterium]